VTDQKQEHGELGKMGSIVDLGIPVPGGAFDEHHPPDAALIGDCVHCGFCLPTCPTYVLWGEEMDSPRGRIYLMKEGLEGEPMTDSMVSHWDACLGCMSCVTACPSGVQYDRLIEQTRAQVDRLDDPAGLPQMGRVGHLRCLLRSAPAPAGAPGRTGP
jgi:glycolate oxidase iron-sulfur subunit